MRRFALLMLAPALALVPGSAPASAPADPDKQVCKKETRDGSRVMTRICKTQADWDAIAEQAKRSLGETRDQPQINPSNCGGSRPC